jgi:8-oxo-dGTP pyrophosphatase MutT (NUDIX family)
VTDAAPSAGEGPPDRRHPNLRPKDSATLIIADKTAGGPVRLLFGRRSSGHVFMPGKYVFPGGRVDRGDASVPAAGELHPATLEKLLGTMKGRASEGRARAIALAAIRETFEEAGLFIGITAPEPEKRLPAVWRPFADRGLLPDLSALRLVAQAVTPPRQVRRFDSRFFVVPAEAVGARLPEGTGPSGELEDLRWATIAEARGFDLPGVTLRVLAHVEDRFATGPKLAPDGPVLYSSGPPGRRKILLL